MIPVVRTPSAFSIQPLALFSLKRLQAETAASIDTEDFDYAPFVQRGGLGKAHQLFGDTLPKLLEELNMVLVA